MMNDSLGQSPPPHPEMFPSPEDLHAFQRLNMGGQPSPLDHGIRHPNSRLNAQADIPPEFVGFTLTKAKKPGQPEKWARYQRTEMKLSERDLQVSVLNEKKKGVSVQKRYLAPEFEGIKREIVDREIELQNRRNPQFKYTLASLVTREGRTSAGQRTTVRIDVILERQPVRTRERSLSFNEEINELLGGQTLLPHARSPHQPGHEHIAHVIPPEHSQHPDHRLFGQLPGDPWVQVGRSEQQPPPPPPPPPAQHQHQPQPQPHPHLQQPHPQQPHPQPHPQSHPHPQSPEQGFSDPFLYSMDAEDHLPPPGAFPEESMRNHPPNHQGREDYKATREHERKPKGASPPSDYDSLESFSDDSGFSGARTHRTGDTEVSDHDGQEYSKRAKPQYRRKDSRRESPTRGDRARDRSRDGRRDSGYGHDGGLDRKDSLRRSRHRRDSDHKAARAYRTHRRKSPAARSPPSSREGSIRYVDGDYEFVPSRTHDRHSPSRRNSQEPRPTGRRFSSLSHPVDIHDDRTDIKEVKYLLAQHELEKLRDEKETLRRENERMAREQEKRIWEQDTERIMRRDRDRDRFDRRVYAETRPAFPEVRYSQTRPQRFSRDMQSNRFAF